MALVSPEVVEDVFGDWANNMDIDRYLLLTS
jgi:hypothetical protein